MTENAERSTALLRGADRGRDTSMALTEVRTVLSRAETALASWSYFERDPDGEQMLGDLQVVCGILDKWKRTGRPPVPKRVKCPACGKRVRVEAVSPTDYRFAWHWNEEVRAKCPGIPYD